MEGSMKNRTRVARLRKLVRQAADLAQTEGLECEKTLRDILTTLPEPGQRPDARHVARKLGSFTTSELQAKLAVSRVTAAREVQKMLDHGTIRDTKLRRKHDGPGRPAPVYEYVQAPATITSRPRQTPVELEAIKTIPTAKGGHRKRRRITNPEIRKLVAACRSAGCRINENAGSGHIVVYTPSGGIVNLPFTPSDHRAVRNCRAELKRAGVNV